MRTHSFISLVITLAGAQFALAAPVTNLPRDTTSVGANVVMHGAAPSAKLASAELAMLTPAGVSLGDVSATPSQPRSGGAIQGADDGENAAAVSLPPAPSSLALVISGLLTLGAYQGTRSLPRLHFGPIPDWYHTDATQIGHVTPLNPNDLVGAAVLDLCFTVPQLSVNIFELTSFEYDFILIPDVIPTRAPRSPPAADLRA